MGMDFVPRIPDSGGFPSSTISLSQDQIIGSDANGNFAVALSPGIANYFQSYNSGPAVWALQNWPTQAAFQAMYSRYRPVSMCVTLQPMMTSMTDSGAIAATLLPRGSNAQNTWAGVMTTLGSFATTAKEGIMVCWRPQDEDDTVYTTVGTNEQTIAAPPAFSVHAGISIAATGLPVSVNCFYMKIRLNLEVIASFDALSPAATAPGPISPPTQSAPSGSVGWYADAMEKLQAYPIGGPLARFAGVVGERLIDYGLDRLRRSNTMPGLIEYPLD